MNIYIANISFKASEAQVKELFETYGEVKSVKIITDRDSGRSRGFGFIEMPDDDAGSIAIQRLNGSSFMDRDLVVNKANPRPDPRS